MTVNDLPISRLEAFYDQLAVALDRAGPQKSEILLVKLALLLANQTADPDRLEAAIELAAQDL
ncbi:hypothetical protein CDO44_18775 [Pigmentiphaga sp. NML080357]|uniref:DUF2783 domain-containing protein n=1 Tax=Pigmentiphaga sp. NML080357 TaxID=2008675 RepID=UPI000B420A2A|nr:DUF2783 domain-containing protein [Pigmentiphaga sp. NML080357]OVZ57153.1 hypothetical protein CDO44_18775 [Pigmentiphaga sp. NML080357]